MDKIVLCPTHQRAVYEFEHLAKSFPLMWKRSMKAGSKMYLESIFGTRYIFMSETEPYKLHGLRSDFISIDGVFNEVSKCQEEIDDN